MPAQRKLLRNALFDMLVEGDRISDGVSAVGTGAAVLDMTDRIALPGFVGTHRHTWQAALRALTVDATSAHTPEDVRTAGAPWSA